MPIDEKILFKLTEVAREANGDPSLQIREDWFDEYKPSHGKTPRQILDENGKTEGFAILSDYIRFKAEGGYE